MASPMPLVPPMMTAVFPLNLSMLSPVVVITYLRVR